MNSWRFRRPRPPSFCGVYLSMCGVFLNIFVNFPRRMVDFYQHINFIFRDEQNITFNVYGGNWGLASNLVHFLDVFFRGAAPSF